MFNYKDYIYNNKEYFLSQKPKYKNYLINAFIVLIFGIIIFLIIIKFYDVHPAKIIVKKNHNYYETVLMVDYNFSKSVIDGKYIVIDGKKYKYKILKKELEINNENLLNYANYLIKINLAKKYLKNNLLFDVKINSSYERGITKIKKIMR